MNYRVEIAESAERDISEVADVVAFAYGDPIGASRLANRIFDAIESLSEMPYRFPLSRNPVLPPSVAINLPSGTSISSAVCNFTPFARSMVTKV